MPVLESMSDQKYQHQLPTVVYRIVDDKALTVPAGVSSEISKSYGYNDGSEFDLPKGYIRFIEPIESELKVQVEYDMDEQDQAWLDIINAERAKEGSGAISLETFEILIDKLEKEWFELIKRIPQPVSNMPVEDSKCAICDDGEGENSNAIVFCDGCNLAVHQDCYGVPYIPEGQWLCRKCTVSPENPVSCMFCPNEGGAFKQTSSGHWSHLLCAIWIPEVSVGNAIYMEPVEGADTVPRNRWKLICSLCREKGGACIQCDRSSCFTAFHVTCARQMGLLGSMKVIDSDQTLRAHCHKHLPAELRAARAALDGDDQDSNFSGTPIAPRVMPNARGAVTTKSARAHAKSYRPGPPIVPQMIVNSLLHYTQKLSIRKREPFVERLCRYWSLKREARRGAPLLKRLHLEPWTASSASKQQTDAEKATKLKFLTKLRNDLEKVRMLAELVRKRETQKSRQMQILKGIVDSFIFPHDPRLRLVLERIAAMDSRSLLLHPVSRTEVPDYFDVIKEPMCWSMIDDKLENNVYTRVADFTRDINLVLDNAMLYNKPDTAFHRTAAKIKNNARPLLDGLVEVAQKSAWNELDTHVVPDQSLVGDLEPSLLLLQTLTLPEEPGSERDNLASIFAFELEKPREPTPPPPPKLTEQQRRQQRREKHEREREEKARQLASGGGLTMRATRGTRALEEAFKKEAGMASSSDVEAGGNRRGRRGAESSAAADNVGSDGVPPNETEAEKEKRLLREERRIQEREKRREQREKKAAQRQKDKERRELRRQQLREERERLAGLAAPENGLKAESATGEEDKTSEADENAERRMSATTSTFDRSSPDKMRRSRSQVGVVGVEAYQYVSDKERRERERALDLVTEEVGSQDQFKRFNVGWVLAEGSKRTRKPPSTDAARLAPPSKTPRSETKSLPPVSAGASSSRVAEPARTLSPVLESGSSLTGMSSSPLSSEDEDEVNVQAASSPRKPQKRNKKVSASGQRPRPSNEHWLTQQRDSNGKFLSKAQRERLRRRMEAEEEDDEDLSSDISDPTERMSAEDDEGDLTSVPPTSPIKRSGETGASGSADEGVKSDLSDLEESDEDMPDSSVASRKGKRTASSKAPRSSRSPKKARTFTSARMAPAHKKAGPVDDFPPGTLVWAKTTGFPFFPAEVIDPDVGKPDEPVPEEVLEAKETSGKINNPKGEPVWLVRFFDRMFSYGWIPLSKIDKLGDDAKDAKYLTGGVKHGPKKSISTSMKLNVRNAYGDALKAMNSDDEDEDPESGERA